MSNHPLIAREEPLDSEGGGQVEGVDHSEKFLRLVSFRRRRSIRHLGEEVQYGFWVLEVRKLGHLLEVLGIVQVQVGPTQKQVVSAPAVSHVTLGLPAPAGTKSPQGNLFSNYPKKNVNTDPKKKKRNCALKTRQSKMHRN